MRKTERTVLPTTIKSYELPDDYIIYSLNVYYQDRDGTLYYIPFTKYSVIHVNDKTYAQIPDISELDFHTYSRVPFFKRWFYELCCKWLREGRSQYFITYARNVPDSIEQELNY